MGHEHPYIFRENALAMDKRGRGRPHYSRPGGRRYIHKSRGHARASNGWESGFGPSSKRMAFSSPRSGFPCQNIFYTVPNYLFFIELRTKYSESYFRRIHDVIGQA
jgi:hypothetical protein